MDNPDADLLEKIRARRRAAGLPNSDDEDSASVGLLGVKPSRNFKIYRTEFPAIFRFNGKLFQEEYDIDFDEDCWVEITEEEAMRWLEAKSDG